MENLSLRQLECLRLYSDPESATYGNSAASAREAGFSDSYALNVTNLKPQWLTEGIEIEKAKKIRLVKKAERNLEEALDIDPNTESVTDDGSIVRGLNPKLSKIRTEAAVFVLKTQGKERGYTEKTQIEHMGAISLTQLFDESKKDE